MNTPLSKRRLQFEMDGEMQVLYSKFKDRFGAGLNNNRLMKTVFKELATMANITNEPEVVAEPEVKIVYYKDLFAV